MAATRVIAQDPFGNTLTLQHETSAAAKAGFVDGFVGYRPGTLALFHFDPGDDAAALKLYDDQVCGVDKTCSQDQVF